MKGGRKGEPCPIRGCSGTLTMRDGPSLVCNGTGLHRVVNLDNAQQKRLRKAQERF